MALARAQGDDEATRAARSLVDDALLFVTRHGENEDCLLLPQLDERAPEVAQQMRNGHRKLEVELHAVLEARNSKAADLYLRLSLFIAHYLEHMYEEEVELAPRILAVLSDEDLAASGQRAVARVDPAERLRMLRLMLPALPLQAAREMLEKMPEPVARELERADPRLVGGAG